MSTVPLVLYVLGFAVLCGAVMRAARRSVLWRALAVLALGLVFLLGVFPGFRLGSLVIPGIAMLSTGSHLPLPVPRFAFWTYVVLIATGVLLVVSASQQTLDEFIDPLLGLLRGEGGLVANRIRGPLLFGVIPLLSAALVFRAYLPPSAPPLVGRQAHPSIGYDEAFRNPLREPGAERLRQYGGPRETFVEAMTHEGRHLYAKNCSPCHGGKADGTGPMARALRLPPANFTDPGTIATLVEGYAFKRVQEGGIGLPPAGTPWDSAMPRWRGDLSDSQIEKILLAEYDLAGVKPRVPERLE
ncbi:MAG: c-type cytochrome [Candidatus Binatia bacterium]